MAFTVNGFNNWKKAIQWFREHNESRAHLDAIDAYKAEQHGVPINHLFGNWVAQQQNTHKEGLMNRPPGLVNTRRRTS